MTLALSVVVVYYDMAREIDRTLRTLSPEYQRGVSASDYEVIVVDNGSPTQLDPAVVARFPGRIRSIRIDPAPPSPALAANRGIDMAEGDLIGLLIDGARMVSPGLLANALLASRLAARPVVATLAWHLGDAVHMRAHEVGYDHVVEDRLLARAQWEVDGYRLFDISTLGGSSNHGWFGPLGESNGLFLTREMWADLGGLDLRFELPGGGRVNHDLYRRACALEDARLVLLLGEGTFHQIHGGAWTSGNFGQKVANEEYEAIRGERFTRPESEPLFLGTVPPQTLRHLEQSISQAIERRGDTGGLT